MTIVSASVNVSIPIKDWEDLKEKIEELDRKAYALDKVIEEAKRTANMYNPPSNDWEKGKCHATAMMLKVWQQAMK